jgi:phospholipid/cholesterol/gamma-HCH transport system substrate-binding protein
MLSMFTKVRVVVFALLAVAVLAFTGIRYANVGRFFGAPGYYVVNVDLADGGGLYPNADVTYRGVTVGRVGAMTLTGSGVRAELDISDSAPRIPARVQAVVADLSAVGEQYLDLRPDTSSGPYLAANDVIAQPDTQIPQPVTDLLTNVDALARSLPAGSLQTVVNELYQAFNGQGPNLQTLLAASSSFTSAASSDITPTSELINEGQGVLATQQQETSAIESFASTAQLFAQQLDNSDSDLRRLITATPQAMQQVIGLLQDNDPNLGLSLANLLTTSDIALTRQPALKELLSVLPAAVAAGNTVITKNGSNFGLTLTFFNPLPCTDGYQGTVYRNGLDTSPAPPLNTAAHCASPSSTGIDVRGSANAPSGGGVPSAAKPKS